MKRSRSIAIVGAGLVGSLMSIYLSKRGYRVSVFEKRPDMRKRNLDGGRSINLALSNRGWWPLKEVGLESAVKDMVIPMSGRMMHDLNGKLTFQPYGKEGQAINSISRGGLNALLMDEAEKAGASFHFECSVQHIDFDTSTLSYTQYKSDYIKHTSDIIIGTDGAFSTVRKFMQMTDRFNYSQHFIEHGYKELTIPEGKNGEFLLDKNALHIWPRGNYMLIALPNKDATFTCTLFFPFEGPRSFNQIHSDEDIIELFTSEFTDTAPLIPSLIDEYRNNPTSSLVTVKCYPWVKNKTMIMGDASHAVVPFYGQGMNCGFEDCRVLNAMLNSFDDDWDRVLPAFQGDRKPDADAISDLALQNFIEMRDLVGDENFLLRKKIEAMLHEQHPEKWVPLYSMVTFRESMKYSKALEKGIQQRKIMDKVMDMPGIENNWQHLDSKSIIDQLKD